MAEIHYRDLKNYIRKINSETEKSLFSPVYLIYGEEVLYKAAAGELLDVLLPSSGKNLCHEVIDGNNENIPDAVERVNTFSLLSGVKVVSINESKIFYSKEDTQSLLEKAKEKFDADDTKKAASYVLSLLGFLNLTFDDIHKKRPHKDLRLDTYGDTSWLIRIIDYCEENGLSIHTSRDNAGHLAQAVEKGFPAGNCLIITTDRVDKRRNLYKLILKKGTVIDCSVPHGDRRADRIVQETVLKEQMAEILTKNNKTMGKMAFSALMEMTGFDLRTFLNNLEKLISYSGDREEISIDDVASVLKRTKKDPIYELTNSVSDKNIEQSLFLIDSLLADNIHPLQVLAAITNQIRKLLLVKDFVLSPRGRTWRSGISFDRFKSDVIPSLQEYDRELDELLHDWGRMISDDTDTKVSKKPGKGRKSETALLVAKNPKNPYPIFLTLQKTENFSRRELLDAVGLMSDADLKLKSSAQNPRLVLERIIFRVCQKKSGK